MKFQPRLLPFVTFYSENGFDVLKCVKVYLVLPKICVYSMKFYIALSLLIQCFYHIKLCLPLMFEWIVLCLAFHLTISK